MKLFHTMLGVVLILCAAVAALACLQQDGHSGSPRPRDNDHMSKGWQAAQAEAEKQERARPLVRQGEQAAAKGRHAEAESLYRKALAIYPHDAAALLHLAGACEREGKYGEAIKAYREVVYSNATGWGGSMNSDPTTRMRYVLALLRNGNTEEAVTVYGMANRDVIRIDHKPLLEVTIDPDHPDMALLEGAAHLVLGTRSPTFGPPVAAEQLAHLKAAMSLQPRWALAQFRCGQALEKAGQPAAARTAYRKAMALADGDLKEQAKDANRRLSEATAARAFAKP